MFKFKIALPFVIASLLIVGSIVSAATVPATPGVCTTAEAASIPGCNPPINISGTSQVKKGGLSVGAFISTASAMISGKLGLGAQSPGPKLYVQDAGPDWLSLALFKNTTATGAAGMTFNAGASDGFWGMNGPSRAMNPNQFFMGNGNANGGFLFFTGGGEAANERMRITSTGNVGIGTTSPATKLAVNGSVTIADGTQGAGKVLTSDANGKASWQTGGGSSSGTGLEALNKHYFITASTYTGNLGGVTGANAKCNSDTNAIAGKNYVALVKGQISSYFGPHSLMGQSFHRDYRLKFYNSSYGDSRSLFSVNDIGGNSFGSTLGPDTVDSVYKKDSPGYFWAEGHFTRGSCSSWTSGSGFSIGQVGRFAGGSVGIYNDNSLQTCGNRLPLLCVEQ